MRTTFRAVIDAAIYNKLNSYKIGCDEMETIHIPIDAERIISTSSKGDQSKWRIGNKWV
ncbi:hypothetical protein MKX79_13135 [Viridibacillus sp. FSL R5-0468]|uniref:hypothetical protein n=1 Tax=Viridibacillus sp. FSL R5-0468 TaxID=2921640 RepID=UPI0030F7E8A8